MLSSRASLPSHQAPSPSLLVELTILLTAASQATGEGSEEARTGLTLNPSGMLALGLEPEAP